MLQNYESRMQNYDRGGRNRNKPRTVLRSGFNSKHPTITDTHLRIAALRDLGLGALRPAHDVLCNGDPS